MFTSQTQGALHRATFATGCFRCTLHIFDWLAWVKDVSSGWIIWKKLSWGYKKSFWVSSNDVVWYSLGHFGDETKRQWLQITFDPAVITYAELLEVFRETVDALDPMWQYHEKWTEHTSALYYHTVEQKRVADISLEKTILKVPYDCVPVQTKVLPYWDFILADDVLQNRYIKNPYERKIHMNHSGRGLISV